MDDNYQDEPLVTPLETWAWAMAAVAVIVFLFAFALGAVGRHLGWF
jgi:hypothetical protein